MSITRKSLFFAGGILLVLLFCASVFFLAYSDQYRMRVYFFPGLTDNELSPEKRSLPRRHTLETDIRLFLEDMILGPGIIFHDRILPEDTVVQSVFVEEDSVLIDFSSEIVFYEETVHMSFEEIVEAIRVNLFYNFRTLKEVRITIEGQELYAGIFTEAHIGELPE